MTCMQDASAVEGCSVAAGLSLGEYCALVFAGAMSFEDGLKVGHAGRAFLQTWAFSDPRRFRLSLR